MPRTAPPKGFVASIDHLPPYGFGDAAWLLGVRKAPIPEGFTLAGGIRPDLAAWTRWVDTWVDGLADWLWPRFDRSAAQWQGAAAKTAIALTHADLAVMAPLRAELWQPIRARLPATVVHRAMFLLEDEGPPGSEYAQYDQALPPSLAQAIAKAFPAAAIATTHLVSQLKDRFQRPRAYQAAQLLGVAGFEHDAAKSASTPSLVSGHCLQGTFAGCMVYARLRIDLESVPGAVEQLQQFCVDPGDRRVFSGVHYPSDNVSSWLTAFELCDRLLGDGAPAARRFLWGAIQRSRVYAALLASGAAPGSPHAPLLEALRRAPAV